MIKIILAIFLSQLAWAKVSLEFRPNLSSVNQGEIVEGDLVLKDGPMPTTSLRGKSIGKIIYVFNIEPFLGNAGSFQAKAKLIFSKVPETTLAVESINGEEMIIFWNNLTINPTEESQSFLLGDFEIPSRKKILPWLIGLFAASITGSLVWFFIKKIRRRRDLRQKKKALRDQLTHASTYDEVVIIWKNKHQTLKEFPTIEDAFKNLEVILFKYQFKPQRSPHEIEQVMESYQKFRQEVLKGTHGI